jgi:F-type H+-transporting ATPase subunit epsilon
MAAAEKEQIIKKLKIIVNSSSGVLYEGEADFLVAPGKQGVLGIGPSHTKMVSLLKKGELIITKREKEQTIPLSEGILQVNRETVDILIAQ